MPTKLADAYVQIIPVAQGIGEGIRKVVDKETDSVGEDAGKKIGNGFATNFLKTSGEIISAGVAGVTAAATAVWSFASDLASSGDAIDKTSQKLGISAENFQALSFAADHCGFSVDVFNRAQKQLNTNGFEGSLTDALDAVMALGTAEERTAKATELFGAQAAMEMAAFLNTGEGLEEYKESLAGLGGLLSDDVISASAAFQDNLGDMMTAFSGLKNNLISDFLPSMNTVMGGITALVSGDESGLEMITEGIDEFLNQLDLMIPVAMETIERLLDTLIDVIVANLPKIIEMGVELIVKLVSGIVRAIPSLVKQAPAIVKALVDGIIAMDKEVMSAGLNMVKGIWNGINNAYDWLKGKIKEFTGKVTGAIKDFFGIHSPSKVMETQVGRFLAEGMAEGIMDNAYMVDDAMEELVSPVSLQKDITASLRTTTAGLSGIEVSGTVSFAERLDQIYSMLAYYFPELANRQLVLDSGAVVGGLSSQFNSEMGNLLRKSERGIG